MTKRVDFQLSDQGCGVLFCSACQAYEFLDAILPDGDIETRRVDFEATHAHKSSSRIRAARPVAAVA